MHSAAVTGVVVSLCATVWMGFINYTLFCMILKIQFDVLIVNLNARVSVVQQMSKSNSLKS